jgi:hypothetical protein
VGSEIVRMERREKEEESKKEENMKDSSRDGREVRRRAIVSSLGLVL